MDTKYDFTDPTIVVPTDRPLIHQDLGRVSWKAPFTEVRPGDRVRHYGTGSISHLVVGVALGDNDAIVITFGRIEGTKVVTTSTTRGSRNSEATLTNGTF